MQSGGYNKQSQEDKALEAGKLGMSSTIKHLSKANSGFASGYRKALGFSKSGLKAFSGLMGKLPKGLSKVFAAFKTVFTGVLPKALIVGGTASALALSSFSSCGYYAGKEGDGKTGSYIDHQNMNDDGEIVYSNANANCRAYYKLLSERKSVWQEYTDEAGNKSLILPTDENAVSDYFKNDKDFYLDPDLLFALNDAIFGEDTVYPEAFLRPVLYDEETYELASLTDAQGRLAITSDVYDKSGKKTGKKQASVSDYGLASVLTYEEKTETTRASGTYYKQDYLTDNGVVKQKDINESYNFTVKTEKRNVLTHAISFAGDVSYSYTPTTTFTKCVASGEKSTNEGDAVEKYEYYNGTVSLGRAVRVIKGSDGKTYSGAYLEQHAEDFSTAGFPFSKTFLHFDEQTGAGYTEDAISAWIAAHENTFSVDGEDITVSYTYKENYKTKDVSLCKYRTSDSGEYVDFVNQGATTVHKNSNQYLYDYLEYFSCYKPVNISRSYESFKKMTSQASNTNSLLSSGGSKDTYGSGKNTIEQLYNGGAEGKERLETIWDILVTFGYSELQAAALMGNMAQESGYTPTAVNSSSGAYGICQWLGSRYTNLENFAGGLGKDISDLEAQANFACMELSPDNTYDYCDFQWLSQSNIDTFKNSTDINEITEVIARGWERCGDGEAYMSNRISNANSAYELFSGRTPEHEAMDISPSGQKGGNSGLIVTDTSGVTRNMSRADKEEFNRFYHAVDNVYDGNYTLEFTASPKGKSEVNKILLLANSFINQSTLSSERNKSLDVLWDEDYLTDLADKKETVSGVYGVDHMDNPRLAVEDISGLPYWTTLSPFHQAGYGLPNCTTWAWGRRYEIEGQRPHLSTGDAHSFWDQNTYYESGQVPKAGAVMVWSKSGGAGHVAIVEQVNADGTITISQSGWKTEAWNPYIVVTKSVAEAEYYAGPPYKFLGYIYLTPRNQ